MGHVGSTLNRQSWFAGVRPSAVARALACAGVLVLSPAGASLARAQSESIVYDFCQGGNFNDGQNPVGDLIADSAGNLYGTTYAGGVFGDGTVFEISAGGTETVLHNFAGSPTDGSRPFAGLVRDANGNLYGTTQSGGVAPYNYGTVFEVSAGGTETVLYSFTGGLVDQMNPAAALLVGLAGSLYGTAAGGNTDEYGTVFRLNPDGRISELYTFAGPPNDGAYPSGIIRDRSGNLYGITGGGGAFNRGTVFELDKSGVRSILHSFSGGSDGSGPSDKLVRDAAGNLYGTTYEGGGLGGPCDAVGGSGCGTVFEVTPAYQETVLYTFTGGADGGVPFSDLVVDGKGNLYGTTSAGGSSSAICTPLGPPECGVVFEVTPTGKEKVLYSFGASPDDGQVPYGGLLRLGSYLYGSTYYGGAYSCGTVYKVAP